MYLVKKEDKMINIKKIVSLLMSVLLIAGSIAAPAFAADSADDRYLLPETGDLSVFTGTDYASMVDNAGGISTKSLKLTGQAKLTHQSKALSFGSTGTSWKEYKYLNFVLKNNNGSAGSQFFFVIFPYDIAGDQIPNLNNYYSNGYIFYKAVLSGDSWTLVSVPLEGTQFGVQGNHSLKNPIYAAYFAQIKGSSYVDSIWLSKTQPTATECTAVSVPNGFDDVAADSASFTFTFNNNLAPVAKQNSDKISFKSAAGTSVAFDADYSGNKLTITPKANLDYGTSYSIKLAGVMDQIGATAKEYTHSFSTTANDAVVATKPVLTTSAGTVQATTTVTNFTADSAAATLVLACYDDDDGKMIKEKTKFEKVELAPTQSSTITASIAGYSGESVYAFVIDSVEARNLLSSDYATLPAQPSAELPTASKPAPNAFTSGTCDFANDVVTFDAKLNGGMQRTLLMSILKGDEVTHMSLLHNDSEGNVNVSHPMTNADASGDYVVELKGRKIDEARTGNYTFLSEGDKAAVHSSAKSLTGSDDALAFLNSNKKALQLDDSTLANDTLMLMTAESLYYNKSNHSDFDDVVSFTKEAVEVCSDLNSQTWDTLADYVINNENILIGTDISDFKALSANNRNKVCYSISPLTFESLSDLNKKLADATRDYLESLEEEKPSKRPSSGGGGGGYSVTGPAVVVPPVVEPPVPVVPQAYAFDDLADYSWAQESINSLLAEGVISQSADAKYRPADRITRAEFVKLVVSALYDATEAADGEFADVAKDEWCYNYIAIAAKRGLVNGREDGTFGKNDYITRQEMAAVIHRALLDLNINLASGLSEYSYGDDGVIADYAKDAVYALYHAGIMTGMADDSFAPAENANRAQAACVIDRIMKGAHNE